MNGPSLRRWSLDRDEAPARAVNVVTVGSSTMEGHTGVTPTHQPVAVAGFPGMLAAHLPWQNGIYYPSASWAHGWATGGPATTTPTDLGQRAMRLGSEAWIERVMPRCEAVSVLFMTGEGGGRFRVVIDGHSHTVSQPDPSAPPRTATGRWVSPRLQLGDHRVRIQALSGHAVVVAGAFRHDQWAGAGVRVYSGGLSGSATDRWISGADVERHLTRVRTLDPGLLIVAMGSNDWRYGHSADTFAANLRTIISQHRAVTDASVLLLAPHCRLDMPGPGWLAYCEAMADVAAETGCGHLDLQHEFPASVAEDDSRRPLIAPDRVHLTPRGHARLGRLVADHLRAA